MIQFVYKQCFRYQTATRTVGIPSEAFVTVNFSLSRDETSSAPPAVVPITTALPSAKKTTPSFPTPDQLEDLLKEKVALSPHLMCLYRYYEMLSGISHPVDKYCLELWRVVIFNY